MEPPRVSHDHVGTLLYAVKVVGPTYAQMQEIRFPSYIDPYTGNKVTDHSRSQMFSLIESVEHDEGFVERYASLVDFFSLDAAYKLWSPVEIASACVKFDHWLRSPDGVLERPSQLQCAIVRRIMEEAKLIKEFVLSQNPDSQTANDTPRRDCHSAPHLLNEANDSAPKKTKIARSNESKERLDTVLARYPYPRTDEELSQWVTAKEAARIEQTVDTDTLRTYRKYNRNNSPAEKAADGLAGRDRNGRIWRKAKVHSQTIYLLASLQNSPQTPSRKPAKRKSPKRGKP